MASPPEPLGPDGPSARRVSRSVRRTACRALHSQTLRRVPRLPPPTTAAALLLSSPFDEYHHHPDIVAADANALTRQSSSRPRRLRRRIRYSTRKTPAKTINAILRLLIVCFPSRLYGA